MTDFASPHVAGEAVDDGGAGDGSDDTGRLVRPYAITGGRTASDTVIDLEAQIQATQTAAADPAGYRWEAAKLVELVQSPMALIELAARLEIPLGVARVLVADLIDDGAVVVHRPASTAHFASLLERVLDGVRHL